MIMVPLSSVSYRNSDDFNTGIPRTNNIIFSMCDQKSLVNSSYTGKNGGEKDAYTLKAVKGKNEINWLSSFLHEKKEFNQLAFSFKEKNAIYIWFFTVLEGGVGILTRMHLFQFWKARIKKTGEDKKNKLYFCYVSSSYFSFLCHTIGIRTKSTSSLFICIFRTSSSIVIEVCPRETSAVKNYRIFHFIMIEGQLTGFRVSCSFLCPLRN